MPGSPSASASDKDKENTAAAGDLSPALVPSSSLPAVDSENPEKLSDAEAAGTGIAVSSSLVAVSIPFRFLFTSAEFGQASAYHFSYQFSAIFWPARIVGLFLIGGVAVAWAQTPAALSIWAGLLQLFSGVVMLTYVQILVWTSLRSFRKSRLHGLLMSVIVNGDGLHIRTGTDSTATRNVPWERFTSAVLTSGGVILYQTTGTFHWLPYSGMQAPSTTRPPGAEAAAAAVLTPEEATAAAVADLAAAANPRRLLEDFLRLHVAKVATM